MCSQPFAAHTHNEWVILLRRLSVMGRCSGTVDERSGQECSHSGCSLVHSPPKICCVVGLMHMHKQPQDNTSFTVPFAHSFVYIFSRPIPTCLGLIPFRRPLVPYGTVCPVMHPLPGLRKHALPCNIIPQSKETFTLQLQRCHAAVTACSWLP